MICQPMMWKILTAQMTGNLSFASIPRTISRRTEGCHRGTRRKGDLLYIDLHIPKESKASGKKLPWHGLTTKRLFDMALQSWIVDCLKMYKISNNVINFITEVMTNSKVEKTLADVKIQRLLFAIAMIPHNYQLMKCTGGYKLTKRLD